jgi:hypothetical protein
MKRRRRPGFESGGVVRTEGIDAWCRDNVLLPLLARPPRRVMVMGIAKKGTRRICVDRVHYRWRAREVAPVGVRIIVQKAEEPGALLVLKISRDRAVSDVTPAEVGRGCGGRSGTGGTRTTQGLPLNAT